MALGKSNACWRATGDCRNFFPSSVCEGAITDCKTVGKRTFSTSFLFIHAEVWWAPVRMRIAWVLSRGGFLAWQTCWMRNAKGVFVEQYDSTSGSEWLCSGIVVVMSRSSRLKRHFKSLCMHDNRACDAAEWISCNKENTAKLTGRSRA